MEDFLYSLGEKIEGFFSTTTAAIFGIVFVAVSATLVLLLLRHFEKRK